MSVRKRTWTTKGVEKSAWVVDYMDTTGKRRLKSFRLKKEADAFAATASVEVLEGTHVADSASVTVEKAGALWLASANAAGLERSTIASYEQHLRLHIVPFIGPTKVSALSIPAVRAFEDQLRENGRTAVMARRVIVSLGTMLADAQERGLVRRNIVRDLRGGRGGRDDRQEKRHRGKLKVGTDIPTREEVKELLSAATGRWRPFLLVATFCGLRASELRGLRWHDVDLERRLVHIRQRADRFNEIGPPKSIKSERTVPAPAVVINALKEWKLACPKGDLDLVFPNGAGKIEELTNILRRGLRPTWIAAGISVPTSKLRQDGSPVMVAKYSGMHALRHFYASWCINRKEEGGLGLPPKTVQDRMGHSTIALTMDRYSHLFPNDDDGTELEQASAWLAN
ncbi:Site-specific recombinase XerD [Fulvimarina manganoxydans]|uniref:Site-specific recombinase XerD n=1 Tax=Fulvimarina manganoxydans TaxID=937218 RepID=A0A1W2BCK2_9HYPH|nr:site-specific integrase [Fulvimarina manganoxydans]SMC70564.1 Site-specific recombinase XerD [Fulvimarina manganoxydans]